jgi:membrane associated rhomboid family serine protease
VAESAQASRTDSPVVRGMLFVAAMAALMWVVEIVDQVAGGRLDSGGIEPRELDGLDGIVFAPFLHGGFDHLIGNTIPFLLLGFASGIVFGYAAYLVARGVFSRSIGQIVLGVVVLAVWGTTLLQGLVPEDGISWQGHLFGAVGGVIAARLLHRRAPGAKPAEPDLPQLSRI